MVCSKLIAYHTGQKCTIQASVCEKLFTFYIYLQIKISGFILFLKKILSLKLMWESFKFMTSLLKTIVKKNESGKSFKANIVCKI